MPGVRLREIEMRQARRSASAAVLALLALPLVMLLTAPVAAAATHGPTPPSTPTGPGRPTPVALASTGLDITVPVIIGLSTLVLGIAFVAWAFLRTGSAHHRP